MICDWTRLTVELLGFLVNEWQFFHEMCPSVERKENCFARVSRQGDGHVVGVATITRLLFGFLNSTLFLGSFVLLIVYISLHLGQRQRSLSVLYNFVIINFAFLYLVTVVNL